MLTPNLKMFSELLVSQQEDVSQVQLSAAEAAPAEQLPDKLLWKAQQVHQIRNPQSKFHKRLGIWDWCV